MFLKKSILQKRKNRNFLGFTLIEIIVAVVILATLSALISQVFFSSSISNTKTELLKEIKQNGDFALTVMSDGIRNTYSIESPCPEAGATDTYISIKNPNATITTYACVGDVDIIRIASISGTDLGNVSARKYLTTSDITVAQNSCFFTCTKMSSSPAVVSISYTLSQVGMPLNLFEQGSVKFKTQATLRNE